MKQCKLPILAVFLGIFILFTTSQTVYAQNAEQLRAKIDALESRLAKLHAEEIQLEIDLGNAEVNLASASATLDSARYWLSEAKKELTRAKLDLNNALNGNDAAAIEDARFWNAYWESVVVDLTDYLNEVIAEHQEAADHLLSVQRDMKTNAKNIKSVVRELNQARAALAALN